MGDFSLAAGAIPWAGQGFGLVRDIRSQGVQARAWDAQAHEARIGIRDIQSRRGRDDKDAKKLREACQEFEAIFLEYILKEMRATLPRDDLFGGGRPEEFFTGLLDEKLAEEMAKGRGMGLGEVLHRQLSGADRHPQETFPSIVNINNKHPR